MNKINRHWPTVQFRLLLDDNNTRPVPVVILLIPPPRQYHLKHVSAEEGSEGQARECLLHGAFKRAFLKIERMLRKGCLWQVF